MRIASGGHGSVGDVTQIIATPPADKERPMAYVMGPTESQGVETREESEAEPAKVEIKMAGKK